MRGRLDALALCRLEGGADAVVLPPLEGADAAVGGAGLGGF